MTDFLFAGAALVAQIQPVVAETRETQGPYDLDDSVTTSPLCIVYYEGFQAHQATRSGQVIDQAWMLSVFIPRDYATPGVLLKQVLGVTAFKSLLGAAGQTTLLSSPKPDVLRNSFVYHLGLSVPVLTTGA